MAKLDDLPNGLGKPLAADGLWGYFDSNERA